MTSDELKKKIAEELKKAMEPSEYGGDSEHAPDVYYPTEEEIADALIAAGLRFGENLTATFDHMALEREHELERRAEIAERALNDCVEYYSYSALCPVLDCNYNKACWRKECTSDIVECFKIQAEEELNKESKN